MKVSKTPAIAPTIPGNDRTVEEFDVNNSTCSISGCEAPSSSRGWCSKHWFRWFRHGDPEKLLTVRARNIEHSFQLRTEWQGDCLIWTGTKSSTGYGSVRHNGKQRPAHRVAYELQVGPLDPTLDIDHICHTPLCVNVKHLRPATKKQNAENQSGPYRNSKSRVRGVTWCKRYEKWTASVRHNGVKHWVGYFTDIEEAERAVRAKRNELFTFNDNDRTTLPVGVTTTGLDQTPSSTPEVRS